MKNEEVQGENKKGIFHEIFYIGFKDAVKSSLGIFKIMLPVSLLMAILNYLGIVDWLSILFQLITNLWGLSGKAILPLLSGYLGSSIITGILLNIILPNADVMISSETQAIATVATTSLAVVLKSWAQDNVITIIKIFVINIVISVAFKCLIKFHIIDKLRRIESRYWSCFCCDRRSKS